MRKRALLAWELGAGLGHAKRLLRIAQALGERGYSCAVASRELWAAADEFHRLGMPVFQAPHHQSRAPENFKARSYADILGACGWGSVATLWPTVLGWEALLNLWRPDVVIGDYSPILALASFGRIPTIAVGDGFVLPPPHLSEFPQLREQGTPTCREADMLAHVAEVQLRRGLPTPISLPALIGGAAHVVCTYPETDIYNESRMSSASGPLDGPAAPLPPPTRNAIFAYLAADYAGTPKLLQVLCDTKLPVEMFVRDGSEALKGALRKAGAMVHDTPPDLVQVLERASLMVHHGGIGTIEMCLALGRPQLLLPRHLEQTSNAAALAKIGVNAVVSSGFRLEETTALAARAASSVPFRTHALAVAQRLAKRESKSLQLILASCDRLA